jgi:hypothetical protein
MRLFLTKSPKQKEKFLKNLFREGVPHFGSVAHLRLFGALLA